MRRWSGCRTLTRLPTKVTYFLYRKQSHPFGHWVFHFLRFFLSFFCATADLKYDMRKKKHTHVEHTWSRESWQVFCSRLSLLRFVCVCVWMCVTAVAVRHLWPTAFIFIFFRTTIKRKRTYVGAFVSIVREAIDPPAARFLHVFFAHIRSSFIAANQAISHWAGNQYKQKLCLMLFARWSRTVLEKK